MAVFSTSGQSFSVDGRRLWLVGAQLDYARIPASAWAERLHIIKEAGFNTIQTASPWLLHEPRKGKFNFKDSADVGHFCSLAAECGLNVLLQVGPSVGRSFDGGGLPYWLTLEDDVLLRSGTGLFMQHATKYLSRLISQILDLQMTKGGPIVAMQIENAWECSNEEESTRYIGELSRFLRESGITIPFTNANDLWAPDHGSVHTWRSQGQQLSDLRQLRMLQPEAPRLVSSLPLANTALLTESTEVKSGGLEMQRQIAEVLAAGGQFVLDNVNGGTNFGFLAGRLAGGEDRFVATAAVDGPLVGEAGIPTEGLSIIRRITTFSSSFGHVFSHLDPNFQPVVSTVRVKPNQYSKKNGSVSSVVTQTGGSGSVVFAFADGLKAKSQLLLPDGIEIPIDLGDQLVGWYLLDVDLCGAGRLDYGNVCPLTVVDRKVAVFFGAAGSAAHLSINGRPLQAVVPKGKEPLVIDHEGVTVVLCNQKQVDACLTHGEKLYYGASWTSLDGTPYLADECKEVRVLSSQESTVLPGQRQNKRASRSIKAKNWLACSQDELVSGTSPRFASLDGPSSLMSCGSPEGYGWYRIELRSKTDQKKKCLLPLGGDRLAWYLDGSFHHISGVGPGALEGQFDLKLSAGKHTLVVLADNLGRLDSGSDLHEVKGVGSELYEVKNLAGVKHRTIEADPISPFAMQPNVFGLGGGEQSQPTQFTWTIDHAKKSPLILDIRDCSIAGCFLLNDEPLIYYSGERGVKNKRVVISLERTEIMKRGKNTLRFAPNPGQEHPEQIVKALRILECVNTISNVSWGFARWEKPSTKSFDEVSTKEAKEKKGTPCWWRTEFDGASISRSSQPLWCDVSSMSKGQLYFNGNNVGRYFNATADGDNTKGQGLLSIPESWVLPEASNEIVLFDEHGFSPFDVNMVRRDLGSRDT